MPIEPTCQSISCGDLFFLLPIAPLGSRAWQRSFHIALASARAAQIELRQQTGRSTLLSAKEVHSGVLAFWLRDETPAANEVLGTLQPRPNSSPAAIASSSLRASAH
jgi:hypothetical protein